MHRSLEVSPEALAASAPTHSCLGTVLFTLLLGLISVGLMAAITYSSDPSLTDGECSLSAAFPEKVRRWCEPITRYAAEASLPPDLIGALIWQESGGQASILSPSGAVGLMQVMPRDGIASDFQCQGQPCFADRPSLAELQDPDYNIQYGVNLLRSLLDHHGGDPREALRAYGPMDVGYHYADTVLSLYQRVSAP